MNSGHLVIEVHSHVDFSNVLTRYF